jgi:hypothetical protein
VALQTALAWAAAHWKRVALWTVLVFAVYQVVIAAVLIVGLGGRPNFVRWYPVWENARRIVALTPSVSDTVTLIAREPLVEYGRLHPRFRAAEWSMELTWKSLAFFLSFSAMLGLYLALSGGGRGWSAAGSIGGAGLVGLLGASVSSLTHCGLGSFSVLLSLAGISATTIAWFGRFEPVLIPFGYGLLVAGVLGRGSALAAASRDRSRG